MVRPDQGNELTSIEQKINTQLKKDPLQEEVDKLRAANEPKRAAPAKPKSRYRRGL